MVVAVLMYESLNNRMTVVESGDNAEVDMTWFRPRDRMGLSWASRRHALETGAGQRIHTEARRRCRTHLGR